MDHNVRPIIISKQPNFQVKVKAWQGMSSLKHIIKPKLLKKMNKYIDYHYRSTFVCGKSCLSPENERMEQYKSEIETLYQWEGSGIL